MTESQRSATERNLQSMLKRPTRRMSPELRRVAEGVRQKIDQQKAEDTKNKKAPA